MSGRIANRMLQIVPSWLRAPMGWSFFGSMVAEMDSVAQDAADGAKASLIISCEEDVLDHHAINSNDRKSSVESYAKLRKYLLSRWDRKKEAGTEDGLHYQLARIGYPAHELVCERDLREAGFTGAFGGNVGYAFLVIRPPNRWSNPELWDGGGTWGGGGMWGASITAEGLAELSDTLQRWKPAGVTFRFVIFDLDGLTTWDALGFHGSYLSVPLFEPWEELTGGPFLPSYNTDFVNP